MCNHWMCDLIDVWIQSSEKRLGWRQNFGSHRLTDIRLGNKSPAWVRWPGESVGEWGTLTGEGDWQDGGRGEEQGEGGVTAWSALEGEGEY